MDGLTRSRSPSTATQLSLSREQKTIFVWLSNVMAITPAQTAYYCINALRSHSTVFGAASWRPHTERHQLL